MEFNCFRRYGVEMEINAFDKKGKSFKKGYPIGAYYIANLVKKITKDSVVLHRWGNDHNNIEWAVKPDSSCGLEICSPVYKGNFGLDRICKLSEAFKEKEIMIDDRCSFHVHIEVEDLSLEELGSLISWWIKCEAVFLDSVPFQRKKNRFCQVIGLLDSIKSDIPYLPSFLLNELGSTKYYTLNTFHFVMGNRRTVEFRIMEGETCCDPEAIRNWVRLLVHFIERAKCIGMPKYDGSSPRSGLLWLDPEDVMWFLGFDGSYELSEEMNEVKRWFITRLLKNGEGSGTGVFSKQARSLAYSQVKRMADGCSEL